MQKTTTEKREAIRLKCIEANPSIMDLVFGCQVRPKNKEGIKKLYKWVWGEDKGEHEHFPVTILDYVPDSETYEERELIEGYMHIGWFDPFGSYVTRYDGRDYLGIDDYDKDMEILGRELLLSDIVFVIKKTIEADPKRDHNEIYFATGKLINIWDPLLPSFSQQSDEFVDFIFNLLA